MITKLVWNEHNNDSGDWCPWSGATVPASLLRDKDEPCPAMCRKSHPIVGEDDAEKWSW